VFVKPRAGNPLVHFPAAGLLRGTRRAGHGAVAAGRSGRGLAENVATSRRLRSVVEPLDLVRGIERAVDDLNGCSYLLLKHFRIRVR
jgi:hypothetical protein